MRGGGRQHVKRIESKSEIAPVCTLDDVPGLRVFADMASPRQRLVRDADAERNGKRRQLREIVCDGRRIAGCMHGGRRAYEQHFRADGVTHFQHRFGDIDLVGVQVTGQALEVPKHLKAGHAQTTVLHGVDGRGDATFVTGEIARRQHHLPDTRRPARGEPLLERARERKRVHAEAIEIHRAAPACATGAGCR